MSENKSSQSTNTDRKSNHATIIFFGILFISWASMSIVWAGSNGFCEEKESGLVCLRNWTNSAGNFFAFVAASCAAYFAFGQMRAANRQAAIAALADYSKYAVYAHELIDLCNDLNVNLNIFNDTLEHIDKALNDDHTNSFMLNSYSDSALLHLEQLKGSASKIMAFDKNSIIYTELYEPYKSLRQICNTLSPYTHAVEPSLNILRRITKIQPNKYLIHLSPSLPQPDRELIARAHLNTQLQIANISDNASKISDYIESAAAIRASALQL